MKTHTIIRSWGAIGLGAFFAGVTGYVLFNDVIHGSPISTGHVLALAALVAAIASGHMVWPALRSGHIIPGLMLVVLFLGSTGYVVVSSGARNAETAGNKAAAIEASNGLRTREEALLTRAEAMLAEAQGKLARECASGRGARCRGVIATVEVYEAAIKGHQVTLAKLQPPQASGYAHAAKVLMAAGVPGTEKEIEARLSLLLPFVTVLIAELGTIAFLHLGIGHERRRKPEVVVSAPSNDPEPPVGDRDPVVDWVHEFRARHGRNPMIPEVQKRFPGTPKTTAWRRATAA